GGYNLDAISASAAACLRVLLGDAAAADPDRSPSLIAARILEAVRRAQGQFWPTLLSPSGLSSLHSRNGYHLRVTRIIRSAAVVLLALPAYAGLAYVVLPLSWKGYQRFAPASSGTGCSRTAEGIPADPLNVALLGSREEVVAAMEAAGWESADSISLRAGIRGR